MLPETMEAAILVQQKVPLEIGTVELPGALEVGQLLVKLKYSGICGSQIGEIDGAKGPDKFLPHLLGHEGSGIVEAIGPGVRTVQVGDHVVLHWRKGAGIEGRPPEYTWQGKKLNAGFVTTFNEYAIVSENRLTTIDSSFDLKLAALFGCAITTGFGVIENNADVRMGQSVVVFGSGGVGLNIVQGASLRNAFPIIAVDLFDNRLDLARQLGATHCVNASVDNAGEKIQSILGETQLDCFIDNTGQPEIIQLGYNLVHTSGKVILVGVPRPDRNISVHSLALHFGKTLTGSHGGEADPNIDINRYKRLVDANIIRLAPLVTAVIKLNDINCAISELKDGTAKGRILIEF